MKYTLPTYSDDISRILDWSLGTDKTVIGLRQDETVKRRKWNVSVCNDPVTLI